MVPRVIPILARMEEHVTACLGMTSSAAVLKDGWETSVKLVCQHNAVCYGSIESTWHKIVSSKSHFEDFQFF